MASEYRLSMAVLAVLAGCRLILSTTRRLSVAVG